jgi:SAM-dependent methyltransferase
MSRRFSTNSYGWWRWVFDHLDLPDRARVLEIGCGTGGLWLRNQDRIPDSWEVTLSDFSKGMLSDAAQNLTPVERPFSYLLADAQSIPFTDGYFDCVIANHVLFFASDVDEGVADILRVLKPSGRLFAATNGRDHLQQIQMLAWETGLHEGLAARLWRTQFCLENGAAVLRAHFGDVQLSRYEDSFFITEAGPLAAHVESQQPDVDRRAASLRLAEFRAFIQDYLRRHGHIWVTKNSGMFEARR